MRENYLVLGYYELVREVEYQKTLIGFSERALATCPAFENQTLRLKKELELLEAQLQKVKPPVPAPTPRKRRERQKEAAGNA
jgi:hypothetical protein